VALSSSGTVRSYDAVVVGAGIVGLACAWRAAQRGLSVLCVDGATPGGGASGAAAGMLAPVTEADFGEEALLGLNLEAAAAWPAFRDELEEAGGIDIGHRASGALEVAADRDDLEELRRRLAFRRSLDLDAEWLTGRECRRLEPGLSPRISAGIEAPGDGHVNPRAVVAALRRAFERSGGELVTGVRATVLVRDDRVQGVDIEGRDRVAAPALVAAAGAQTRALPGLDADALPPVRPVKGQILRLRVRPGASLPAARVIRSPRCYVVSRDDGEVVVGATVEERGYDTSVTGGATHDLLRAALELVPDMRELTLVETSAGLRPGTPDNAPVIGTSEVESVVLATGHYRNGILLAPITADSVVELVATGRAPDAIAAFSPRRFDRSERVAS